MFADASTLAVADDDDIDDTDLVVYDAERTRAREGRWVVSLVVSFIMVVVVRVSRVSRVSRGWLFSSPAHLSRSSETVRKTESQGQAESS